MLLKQPEKRSRVLSKILFWYYRDQPEEKSGTDSKNTPKIMQQRNCYAENLTVRKQLKNQSLIQCILIPQFCFPTFPREDGCQLNCISFEQERVRNFRPALLFTPYISNMQNPPLLKRPPHSLFGGMEFPFQFVEKTWTTYALGRFLNQVILTELPTGKWETIRKVCLTIKS